MSLNKTITELRLNISTSINKPYTTMETSCQNLVNELLIFNNLEPIEIEMSPNELIIKSFTDLIISYTYILLIYNDIRNIQYITLEKFLFFVVLFYLFYLNTYK